MKQQIIQSLYQHNMIKLGDFILKSGQKSDIYIDVRSSISYPKLFKIICDVYSYELKSLDFNFICGVPYSALTFASAIAYKDGIPMLLKRKEVKSYGTKKILEGDYQENDKCVIIEDVITTGGSILDTISILEEHHIKVTDIITLIDRQQGGVDMLNDKGYNVKSIIKLQEIYELLK
jgi:orotate phosphoribosyltransferase